MYNRQDKIGIDQYNGYYACFIVDTISYNKYSAIKVSVISAVNCMQIFDRLSI